MNNTVHKFGLIAVLVALSGCSSSLSTVISQKDGAPRTSVDARSLPDITPEPVMRTNAGNKSPYTVLGQTYEVLPSSHGFIQEGTASWYGRKFHGRPTSNGERFDMYGMTAAHKSLPIPTYVEVTNLDNGRKVVLRVNDRGPFLSERNIDLSWGAAAKLGFADLGTARVRVVALDPDDPLATLAQHNAPQRPQSIPEVEMIPPEFVLDEDSYYQVALMSQRQGANIMAAEVEAYTKFPVTIAEDFLDTKRHYRVLIGPLMDRREANELGLVLELAGLSPGFIVKLSE
ncbi:MAG: septal ring lytic transglycosylase RlpA family protein [Pseudomonadales bacterium]